MLPALETVLIPPGQERVVVRIRKNSPRLTGGGSDLASSAARALPGEAG
jgi:hypothetical protein